MSTDQNESLFFSSHPNTFFLVIQQASEPLCFISLPCYSVRIRSADDLWDRSDPPTARSDAPTCGCTREYDKSRWIWARNAHGVPFETGRTSRANVCSFSRTSRLSCIRWSMILQWQSLFAVNRCDVNCKMKNRPDEHDRHLTLIPSRKQNVQPNVITS